MIQTTQFMAAYRLFLCNYLQENLSSNTSIVLSSPLRHVALSNDPNVVEYTQNQPELDAVCRLLPRAQKDQPGGKKTMKSYLWSLAAQEIQ